MRDLVYFVAVSLDGFIAAPNGSFEAFPMEGDHLTAIIESWSDTIPGHVRIALDLPPAAGNRFDTVLMGWNTYATGLAAGIDSPYPHLRQFVVSTRHPAVPEPVTVIAADPVGAVRLLKDTPGGTDIWLCGGGRLAAALRPEIDRLVLKVNPIVLGSGIPLFNGDYEPSAYTLVSSTRYESGVLINDYDRHPVGR